MGMFLTGGWIHEAFLAFFCGVIVGRAGCFCAKTSLYIRSGWQFPLRVCVVRGGGLSS